MKPYGLRKGAWDFAPNDRDVVLIAIRGRGRAEGRRAIEEGERDVLHLSGMHEEIAAHACEAGLPCPTCGPFRDMSAVAHVQPSVSEPQ